MYYPRKKTTAIESKITANISDLKSLERICKNIDLFIFIL